MPSHHRAHVGHLTGDFDDDAVAGLGEEARRKLGGDASCAIVFLSESWGDDLADFIEVLQISARCPTVAGCSADGFLAEGQEFEEVAGCCVLFLRLENAEVRLHHFSGSGSNDFLPLAADDSGGALLMANPVGWDPDKWLENWNAQLPDLPCAGGLASGSQTPDELFVFTQEGIAQDPVLAISLHGDIRLSNALSQGCRPIGEPYTITKVEGNIIHTIGSVRAMDVLEEAFQSLDDDGQLAAQGNILAGLAMSEYRDEMGRGDFLISSILGGDPDAGALAVSSEPSVGQTLQFQLRDAIGADTDLRTVLARQAGSAVDDTPFAALAFTCTGRGENLFGDPHHDATLIEETFPGLATAGFFGNGELGKVGGKLHVHGFTASIGFLHARDLG